MASVVLEAELRRERGTHAVRRLRGQGKVPVVLYGLGKDNLLLCVQERGLRGLLNAGARMVNLKLNTKEEPALIKEIQFDTLGRDILHVDLLRVSLSERIQLEIPVELKGTPKGAQEGGMVEHTIKEIKVECLPTAIPDKVVVDISPLGLGDSIQLKDLKLPEGVSLVMEMLEAPVVSVRKLAEEVLPPVTEEVPAEPELVKKPKEEEEQAEGEEKA